MVPKFDFSSAKKEQELLRKRVRVEDDFEPLKFVAGTDVGFEDEGKVTRAAVVVLRFPSLEIVEEVVTKGPTPCPYVPGFLSFREVPQLIESVKSLSIKPDLFLCDGLGIAHPRRLGLASHFGVTLDVPTIGVAKSILVGTHEDLPETKGTVVPLIHTQEHVGWVLRSKDRVRPLIVSPGHRVSMETALEVVLSCLTKYRLPEPTRLADKVASQRGKAKSKSPDKTTSIFQSSV